MKKIFESRAGITLVALVITVIVLLILVGITISQMTKSGLFDKTNTAKSKYNLESTKERVKIAYDEYIIEKNISGKEDEEIFWKLEGIESVDIEDKILIKINGYSLEIDENGEIFESVPIEENAGLIGKLLQIKENRKL